MVVVARGELVRPRRPAQQHQPLQPALDPLDGSRARARDRRGAPRRRRSSAAASGRARRRCSRVGCSIRSQRPGLRPSVEQPGERAPLRPRSPASAAAPPAMTASANGSLALSGPSGRPAAGPPGRARSPAAWIGAPGVALAGRHARQRRARDLRVDQYRAAAASPARAGVVGGTADDKQAEKRHHDGRSPSAGNGAPLARCFQSSREAPDLRRPMARLGEVTMRRYSSGGPGRRVSWPARLALQARRRRRRSTPATACRRWASIWAVRPCRSTAPTDGVTTRFRFENDALLGLVEASDLQMRSVVAPGRGKVLPKRFEGTYSKDDRVREVDLAYGAGGAIDGFQLIKRGRVRVDAVPPGPRQRARSTRWRRCCRSRAWLDQAPEGRRARDPGIRRPQALRCDAALSRPDPGYQRGWRPHPPTRIALRYQLVASLNEDTGKFEPEPAARLREMRARGQRRRPLRAAASGRLAGRPADHGGNRRRLRRPVWLRH